jgi:glycosyltransferase involved in cell wall biosynthesis
VGADGPALSLIIPTYNRRASVLRTLESLEQQTYPVDRFEVVVVDDGSTDGTKDLVFDSFPFRLRYFRQHNSGATTARNAGAIQSRARILVFMDDDIAATPTMLEHLVWNLRRMEKIIALATLVPVVRNGVSPFAKVYGKAIAASVGAVKVSAPGVQGSGPTGRGSFVHFIECMTGVLAIKREDFIALGMFEDPTGGWPNWDDVDFGYRAHLQGFRLWRDESALAYHHDCSLESLAAACDRWERASRSAALLFQKHPGLQDQMLMFRDKGPTSLTRDSPGLVGRKVLRNLVSSPPSLFAMQRLARFLEAFRPHSFWLVLLYRWIVSSHIRRGYRQGLRELAEPEP